MRKGVIMRDANDRELGGGIITSKLVSDRRNIKPFQSRPTRLGEPTNTERADQAAGALLRFASITGMLRHEDVETTLSDLLADLMHLADREVISFDACMRRAENNYQEECR